ncbi:MAG: hypothetical protein ACK500_10760 [Flavobacteriales bacterium]
MFGILRFLFRTLFVLLIVAAVVGYFTNPTRADFAEKADTELRKRLGENGMPEEISEARASLTRQVIEGMVRHTNYHICGVFTISVPMDKDYSFLGVFGQFIPLQSDTPLEWTDNRQPTP